MKKYLIRSGISPLESVSFETMFERNILGGNVGNLAYDFSIHKTLMVDEETMVIPTYRRLNFTDEEIEIFNSEYEALIIPLADAFRPDFMEELRAFTKLVKALKIPTYVIGVGIRASYDNNLEFSFDFNKDVTEFIKAVLDKSNIMGLRGHITGEYFKQLGFKEEKDYTVVGCPSMYTFGDNIKIRDIEINSSSNVCFNINPFTKNETCEFILKSASQFNDAIFIPQDIQELKLLYAGETWQNEHLADNFPKDIKNDLLVNGKARFFGNIPLWIDYMKQRDFSFGTRQHGNIIATLAGTPSVLFAFDARERELAEYHNLTSIAYKDIKSDMNIFDIIEKVDFHSAEKVQKRNFNHFIDFLNKNNINHIYKDEIKNKNIMEQKLKDVNLVEPIKPITISESKEIARRLNYYDNFKNNLWTKRNDILKKENNSLKNELINLRETNNNLRDKILKLKEKNNKLKSKLLKHKEKIEKLQNKILKYKDIIDSQNKKLNYKSIQTAMKIRNKIEKIRKK